MATISKTSTFEVPKFSQGFSPSPFRWVLPAGLAMGPRLPRQNTTDSGSREGPRFGPPAASRGQGSPGCEEQHGPWPRTRDFGENTLLRQWDLYVRKGMKC